MITSECYNCGQVQMDFKYNRVKCLYDEHYTRGGDGAFTRLYANCPKKKLKKELGIGYDY